MFNHTPNTDEAYLQTIAQVTDAFKDLAKSSTGLSGVLAPLIAELSHKAVGGIQANLNKNLSKIVIETEKDSYSLVADDATPGAFKWKKVEASRDTPHEPNELQCQQITAKLIKNVPEAKNLDKFENPKLQISAYFEENGEESSQVVYQENAEGECTINKVTQDLSLDKILKIGSKALSILVPPNIIKDYNQDGAASEVDSSENNISLTERGQKFSETTLLTESVLSKDHISSNVIEEVTVLDNSLEISTDALPQTEFKTNHSLVVEGNSSKGNIFTSVIEKKIEESANLIAESSKTLLVDESSSNKNDISATEPRKETTLYPLDRTASAVVTHKEILKSESSTPEEISVSDKQTSNIFKKKEPEEKLENFLVSPVIEPVRQAEVISQKNKVEQVIPFLEQFNARRNLENKEAAKTAAALLTKYGTKEPDGTLVYRSDAFAIRQEGNNISLHRRQDEATGWKDSLMDFSLKTNSSGDREPIISKVSPEMLPVEHQEFLIASENIKKNRKLPELGSADIRDVANTLGSLAPTGTIRTLDVFKENNLLSDLAEILKKAGKDEVVLGDFTVQRSRDEKDNNRTSLQVFKNIPQQANQELVRYDRTVDAANNASLQVSKMNISEYDINSLKFLANNLTKLNDLQTAEAFNLSDPTQSVSEEIKTSPNLALVERNAGDIIVPLHPVIKNEYPAASEWIASQSQTEAENIDKTKQLLESKNGRLTVADQGVMYSHIEIFKSNQVEPEIGQKLLPWSSIQADLLEARGKAIFKYYTPQIEVPAKNLAMSQPVEIKQKAEVEL